MTCKTFRRAGRSRADAARPHAYREEIQCSLRTWLREHCQTSLPQNDKLGQRQTGECRGIGMVSRNSCFTLVSGSPVHATRIMIPAAEIFGKGRVAVWL